MKVKKLLIISIIATSFLTGCNKQEVYEITETSTELQSNTSIETESISEEKIKKDKELENILEKSEKTIDISKKLNGTDMSEMLLAKYSEEKFIKLDEIIDKTKPTVIFISSPYCGACVDINYTELLTLKDSVNIIITMSETLRDDGFIDEKGLISNIYFSNTDYIANTFADDETLKDKYKEMMLLGLPSSIYINSDMTFEFAVSGTKYANEILSYIEYLN